MKKEGSWYTANGGWGNISVSQYGLLGTLTVKIGEWQKVIKHLNITSTFNGPLAQELPMLVRMIAPDDNLYYNKIDLSGTGGFADNGSFEFNQNFFDTEKNTLDQELNIICPADGLQLLLHPKLAVSSTNVFVHLSLYAEDY